MRGVNRPQSSTARSSFLSDRQYGYHDLSIYLYFNRDAFEIKKRPDWLTRKDIFNGATRRAKESLELECSDWERVAGTETRGMRSSTTATWVKF
jgi:hypothetical protein